MADVCTRSDEVNKTTKKATQTNCKQVKGQPPCALCPGCQMTCINSTPHKNCIYNIRNTSKLAELGPQTLKYEMMTEHTVVNEGKSINYKVACTQFAPHTYKVFPIQQIMAEIQQTTQQTLDQNQTASTEQAIKEEIHLLSQNEEVTKEIQQIETITRPNPYETNPTTMQVQQGKQNTNDQPIVESSKLFHRTMPNGLYRINTYSKQKWQPTKHDANNTTVILFTSSRKSLRIAGSLYAQQLVGTPTEKLERRVKGVTYTENPGGLNYLISCTPQDRLDQSNHPTNAENFLPQLRIAIKEAIQKSPNRKLIIDGNSIQKYYNLSGDTIMTGIILLTKPYKTIFQDIGLVMWHKNDKQKNGTTDPLKINLPIYRDGIRQGTTTITLNNRGQCPNLPKLMKTYTWNSRHNHIQIEHENKTKTELQPHTNLSHAQAIHIIQPRRYARCTQTQNKLDQTKINQNPIPQFTSHQEQSSEPILDAMLAKRKLQISQANDPYLTPIQQQLRQASENKKVLQSECGTVQLKMIDDVVYGKSSFDHNNEAWKPVLPEGMLITEIMLAHETQRCSSIQNAIEQIKRVFFHKKNVTSYYDLNAISKKVLPCPRCVIRRPTHRTGNKLYMQTKNIAMSLGGLPCATLAHDIVYITNPKNHKFTDKYLSVIVCYGCSYVHLKLINQITGHNIATHLLDMIQITGQIPHVLITDSATTELRGIVAQCIQSLNIIQLKTNQQILDRTNNQKLHHERPRPQEEESEETDPTIDPKEFPTELLDNLTTDQKNMLLQDFKDSAPPIYPPILTHNPVPYIDKHAYRTTSLGRLDFICGEIGVFLRKFMTTQPQQVEDENIEHLIQSYAYYHNFIYQDVRTKQPPAKLHLGILRFHNTQSLMSRLQKDQSNENSTNGPKPITTLQNMLTIAYNYHKAQENRINHEKNQQRDHQNKHGRLSDEEKIETMFPVLSIIMLQNEIDRNKTSKFPTLHGPHLVLAHVQNKRTMYLLSLIEGHIYKRSYRAIQKLLPSQELFSTPNITDWFQYHPLQLISKLSNIENMEPQLTTDQYTKVLQNLSKVYELLKPVLPTVEEVQKTISIAADPDIDTPTEQTQRTTEEMNENTTTRKTVKFRTEEPVDTITDITLTHKKKEAQETQPKHQHQYQQQPGINVKQPPKPQPTTPPPIEPTRAETRPKRTRIVPAKFR